VSGRSNVDRPLALPAAFYSGAEQAVVGDGDRVLFHTAFTHAERVKTPSIVG
jgi:hypothetical protein